MRGKSYRECVLCNRIILQPFHDLLSVYIHTSGVALVTYYSLFSLPLSAFLFLFCLPSNLFSDFAFSRRLRPASGWEANSSRSLPLPSFRIRHNTYTHAKPLACRPPGMKGFFTSRQACTESVRDGLSENMRACSLSYRVTGVGGIFPLQGSKYEE